MVELIDKADLISAIELIKPKFTYPKGTYQCFHCGAQSVVWQSDFDLEDLGYEGEGIVHMCECSNCGAEIEYRIYLGDLEDDDKTGKKNG